MGFLVKSFLVILLIAVAGGFLINSIPSWKQHVIEVINPAAKEARLLGEMKTNLDELSKNTSDPQAKSLLSKSQDLLQNITDINQNNSGIIRQSVSKIIDALIDRTPYPAENLTTSESTSPTPVCSPVK